MCRSGLDWIDPICGVLPYSCTYIPTYAAMGRQQHLTRLALGRSALDETTNGSSTTSTTTKTKTTDEPNETIDKAGAPLHEGSPKGFHLIPTPFPSTLFEKKRKKF